MNSVCEQQIMEIRKFNRFYTNVIGLLNQTLLASPYSLAEARVLLEMNTLSQCTSSDLVAVMKIDAGYLSRILNRFMREGLIEAVTSDRDKRSKLLSITAKGRNVYQQLADSSNTQIAALLQKIPKGGQQQLVNHMLAIQNLLADNADTGITIRESHPGEAGYIAYRHGILYAQEYHLDGVFNQYVMESLTKYVSNPQAGKIFMAECCGTIAGFIGVVETSAQTAQLRWFLIEPEFRGAGLGRVLVSTAVNYCKSKGYQHLFLWTFKGLEAARHLYEEFGFTLTEEVANSAWRDGLVEQRWDCKELLPEI